MDADCHWAPIVGFSHAKQASPSALLQVHSRILGVVLPKAIVIARVFFPLYSRMKIGVARPLTSVGTTCGLKVWFREGN